ncbi:C1q domain containing protein [uncultured Caudovirales phage]|uniref:C1q domain containing protein n=1 Tax=uncultured Caudovirales phage TaxID=2100421 RepID=A0A6J5LK38_9CAUD|nr:C1q domain containing protein [uncultured Caudovirales phage]
MAKLLNGTRIYGNGIVDANLSVGGIFTVTYQPTNVVNTAIQITAANTIGGTGYADVLRLTNSSSGATFPNKTIRLNNTGGLEVIDSNYGNNIFTLDNTGNITTNGFGIYSVNRPAFRVVGNGGQIAATANVTSSNWTLDYQQGTGLNAATGVFTAPYSGLYQVNLVARTNSNTNSTINQCIIQKNGSTVIIMVEFGINTTMDHTGGSTIVKMAAGDTLQFKVLVGTISFDGNDNWSVAYIG